MWEHDQTSTTTATSSPGATTSSPSSTPTNTPSPSSALSGGAKAGIGIGAALAVCIGLVLLWFGWRRAKRRHTVSSHTGKLDSKSRKFDGLNGASEMQGRGVFEAPGDDLPREVEGHHTAHSHELEGSRR